MRVQTFFKNLFIHHTNARYCLPASLVVVNDQIDNLQNFPMAHTINIRCSTADVRNVDMKLWHSNDKQNVSRSQPNQWTPASNNYSKLFQDFPKKKKMKKL